MEQMEQLEQTIDAEALLDLAATYYDQIGLGIFIAALILQVCYYWGRWKVFQKMYIPGWKSIIPIWSDYILLKTIWTGGMFWLLFTWGIMLGYLPESDLPHKFIVFIAAAAIYLILQFKACHKLAKAFGRGVLFAIGLFFCKPLFWMILGLGKSEFQEFRGYQL